MVAAVAVETRQKAKRNKAVAEEEEEEEAKTPSPSPLPPSPSAVRRHRQPTPDHPPYCWMIGEAIDELGENGGSTEDSISSFIRARHPGVPIAHDRFLRHYLTKHVAEGFFVCTAQGRYARSHDEAAAVDAPVEPTAAAASEAARAGSPVAQAKRGRGRPRKDGSSPTSPAGKKDRRAGSATPKRLGRPPGAAPQADGDGSVPSAGSATPKRRGRPPTRKPRGRPPRAAPQADGDGSVPTSPVPAADKDGSQATASAAAPRRRRRLRKLASTADVSGEALVTDEDDIEAPSTTGKEHGRSFELAMMVVGDGSTTGPIVDNVCSQAPPTTPVDSGQPRELALVTSTDVPAPMPPVDKQDGISATATSSEPGSQARELALVAADDGPVPVLVADKKDIVKAPFTRSKRLCQPPNASPMVISAHGSTPTPAAGKKARGKALSATPKTKGGRRQRKLALVTTDVDSAATPVAGKKAVRGISIAKLKLTPANAGGGNGAPSVAPKPSRLYPVTADEIPDDPSWCLLALPAVAVANP